MRLSIGGEISRCDLVSEGSLSSYIIPNNSLTVLYEGVDAERAATIVNPYLNTFYYGSWLNEPRWVTKKAEGSNGDESRLSFDNSTIVHTLMLAEAAFLAE